MADGEVTTDDAQRTIELNVVSPSAEAQRLTFPDTPITTTIKELKLMIQGAVASRPLPERQRLIYQGKPLVQQEATVETVLGHDALQASRTFTFHLVLPPPNPSTATSRQPTRSPSAPPTTLPSGSNPQNAGGTADVGLNGENSTRLPQSQYNWAQPPQNTFGPPPVPGFTGMPQHNFGQFAHLGPQTLPPHMQQAINQAHQQFSRQMQGGVPANDQQNGSHEGQENGREQSQTPVNRNQNRTPTHSTVIREGQMPGGQGQWRMIVNQTTVPISMHGQHQQSNGQQPRGPYVNNTTTNQNNVNAPAIPSLFQPPRMPNYTSLLAQEAHNRLAQSMANIRSTTGQLGQQNSLLPSFPTNVYLLSGPSGYQALLMSPNGAYSSPGFGSTYPTSTQPSMPHLPPNPRPSNDQPIPQASNQNQSQPRAQPAPQGLPPNPQQPVPPAPRRPDPNQPRPQNEARRQQQPRNNDAADLLGLVMNIGGNIWVVVRLLGFIWLVTHGSSWVRTFTFGIAAVVVFLAQTGALRRPLRAVFTPVRRHLEDLLNEDDAEAQLNADASNAATNPGSDSAPGTGPRPAAVPTPEERAARLLRERRERDTNWARRRLRRAERAVVLFAASLVPGVGELHVRARERRAREAAEREVEERRRAEQAQREAEERQQQQQQSGEGEGDGGASAEGNDPVTGGGGDDSAPAGEDQGVRRREGFEANADGGN